MTATEAIGAILLVVGCLICAASAAWMCANEIHVRELRPDWQPTNSIYCAGPMSAFWERDYNRAEFERHAELLRRHGFTPIIPHELDKSEGIDLSRQPSSFTRTEKAAMMRRDVAAIDRSIAVWTFQRNVPSLGRDTELAYAAFVGVPVFDDINELVKWSRGNAKPA